jgi:hypothetical protein
LGSMDKLRDKLANKFDIFIDDQEWRVHQKDPKNKQELWALFAISETSQNGQMTARAWYCQWHLQSIVAWKCFWMTKIGSDPWGMLVWRMQFMCFLYVVGNSDSNSIRLVIAETVPQVHMIKLLGHHQNGGVVVGETCGRRVTDVRQIDSQ